MQNYQDYTQFDYWNMLPLSDEQKFKIYNDFIKTDKYDKIPEKKPFGSEESSDDLKTTDSA
jgi:hypothetical protein